MTVRVQIGEQVYEVSPLPLRFVVAHADALDRFKLPPLAPGTQPEDGAPVPMADKERFELMFKGLVASIKRKHPDLDPEKLADDLDHESIVRAWIAVMENSTVRRLLERAAPGKERPVLTAETWGAIQTLPPDGLTSTGVASSPGSSPAPAGP